jgi:hypothetical protein
MATIGNTSDILGSCMTNEKLARTKRADELGELCDKFDVIDWNFCLRCFELRKPQKYIFFEAFLR